MWKILNKNAMIEELHDKLIDDKIVPKEGQQDLSCSNNKSSCCPSLGYKYVESAESEDKLHRAFARLFEATIRLRKENGKYKNIKTNIDVLQGEHVKSGGPADD